MNDSRFIEIRELSKSYREGEQVHVVLDRAEISIAEGELVVLLGRSGSGKTTLLNLLSGIDLPDAGEVTVDGIALHELTERERTLFRRRRIGFVFQFFNLLPTLTVEENLLLPLELSGRLDDRARRRALDLLDRVGLAGRERSFPERLSGGEQQRVAIARALVHRPDLLLADEPTGNLDADTGLEILELLDTMTRQEGRTLVMATHSREVARVADRVFRIDHGRPVEIAPAKAPLPAPPPASG
ncbi:MAG: ABC transporter ATP-binding protein [bacterium]|nr:ABC transporter ATP-binding protein [bacterium]